MPLRYVCPHCQGSGKKYGITLLSFIKCKICDGEGYVIMSTPSPPTKRAETANNHSEKTDSDSSSSLQKESQLK
ncbi:hypothetical protein FZC66_05785 [Priestia megaterium]|nr:hypothetical protein FZC66_05785 [Priestia megaterium]